MSDPARDQHGIEVDQEQEIEEKYEITKNSEETVYMVYVRIYCCIDNNQIG